MNIKLFLALLGIFSFISCTSTKNTIQNIDYKATRPKIIANKYVLTDYAPNDKYGYDKNFPINIGVASLSSENYFIKLFFNAITDIEGNAVMYEKIDTCCPFPSANSKVGAGLLHRYKVTFKDGTSKELFFNIYEKGAIMCPTGFKIAQS